MEQHLYLLDIMIQMHHYKIIQQIQEMVFERYDRMKDIFDDVLWAFDWKVKTGGDFEDLFEALAKHNKDRAQRRDRNKGKEGFDPAYA